VAARKYSYTDMLQTAINKTAAAEAMTDALRDYLSNCGDGKKGCEGENEARCPSGIDEQRLQRAVERFLDCLEELPPSDLVRLLKALAMMAIALAPRYRCRAPEQGEEPTGPS